MAQKAIVDIQINDGPFRDFYEMFSKYQRQLSEMPDDWKKVVDAAGDGNGEMEKFAKSAMSSKDFLMIAAIQADAISVAMSNAISVQSKFNTKAKDGSIQMGRMAKFSKEMHKDISKMSSIFLKIGALGASAMALPAAVFASTNVLAGQNLQARGLGLKIGQTQAFEANFEKFGLGTSDLGNVANAQGDPSKLLAFISAGLTPEQVQNEDAEKLTYDFSKGASQKYREWMKSGPLYANSMATGSGFTGLLSLQQLRTGASYSDADWQKAQEKEIADAKRNEVNQGTADQASDVKAALKSDWAQVMNEFNGQLAQMSPELKIMGDAAAAAAVNLLKVAGPEAKKVMDALEGAPISRDAAKQGGVVGGLATMGYGIRDYFSALTNTRIGTPTDSLPSMLDAQYTIESGRGQHNLSPKGAMGPMQFMPDTWKEWGKGDVNNLQDSQDAARRYDSFLLKRYSGDNRKALAAYNWGMGNVDKDIAANGDKWEQHAPKETQQYIGKIMALMAKQGQNVNINITNSTTANVATSMNAAPH